MNSDLLDGLISKPQRETAGADSASRFDYQKSWGFCEMLRRHMTDVDYLVAFEFHDDVVFLEPNALPAGADFFQVKTVKSTTPRKLSSLMAKRSKSTNSILGKMFSNFSGICSAHQVKVILVSNVAFEFTDEDLCAKDLDPKYKGKIVEKLKAELPGFSESQIDNLHFMITGVSIDSMNSFLLGEAMELFKKRFGEEHGLNIHGWVRLLQSEISRKNNYASNKVTNVAELMSKKCIGRAAVENSLSLISTQRRATPQVSIINDELKAQGWTGSDLIKLSKKMPTATADYTDATNLEAASIVKRLEQLFYDSGDIELGDFVAKAEAEILHELSQPYRDRLYLVAMSIVVFHEKI